MSGGRFALSPAKQLAHLIAMSPANENGCHIYSGSIIGGYGECGWRREVWRVHRLVWLLSGRELPDGVPLLHRCHNRACCNPEHLYLGTAAQNSADMIAAGRSLFCERNPAAKLSPEQVAAIRTMSGSQRQIGAQFGVSKTTIGLIRAGKTWQQLEAA